MTFASQLQGYFAAAHQLAQLADLRQTQIAEDQFLGAVHRLRSSLDELALPGMPSERLARLDEEIRRLSGFPFQGHLYSEVARSFIQRLRDLDFLPPARGKESPRRRYRRLIGLPSETAETPNPADALVAGSQDLFDRRMTRRGLGIAEAMYVAGLAVETDMGDRSSIPKPAQPLADRPEETVPADGQAQEPDAVVNPFTGELLAAGRLWVAEKVRENGRDVEKTVRSPYRLERRIGQGGTSCVYLAREDGSERELAVKIVNRAASPALQEGIYQGFLREKRLSGSTERERSMKVFTSGHTAAGFPFMVMEYLSGGGLHERIGAVASGDVPFDLKEAVSLCAQAVAAVAEAHRDGIVHLDVKPENFFLSRDRRKVKLGDYGLATLARTAREASSRQIFGTFGYVPLENIPTAGHAAPVGAERRDVWALGATLYEVLTGVFPFEGPSLEAMLAKMVTPVKPPSEIRKEIPTVLDRVVMKALSADPQARYADAEEMLFDLVSYVARDREQKADAVLERILSIEKEAGRTMRAPDAGQEKTAYLLKREAATLRESWRSHLEDALREYGRLLDEFPGESVREKMLDLNLKLHRWASSSGDDEGVRHRAARIAQMAPSDHPAVREVTAPVHVEFFLDGRRPRGAEVKYNLIRAVNRRGVIQADGFLDSETVQALKTGGRPGTRAFDLERGAVHGARFLITGAVPVFIPIPVRPGRYALRVPIYRRDEIPERYVLVPAGPVAAREGPGSYSERFDNWRVVEHDYAIGPLVTNAEYGGYLRWVAQTLGPPEAERRTPRHWRNPLHPMGPVTHLSYGDALKYLEYLGGKLGMPVRLPTLNEWKRALRGNDARLWPWGDAPPDLGLAAFRYPAPGGSGIVAASAIDDPDVGGDLSPFSVPGLPGSDGAEGQRLVKHLAGNVQKLLDFGTPRERTLIARKMGLSVTDLVSKYYLAAGASYDGPAPSNPDILMRKGHEEIIAAGIMPVVQLRSAPPTPSPESLAPNP